MEVSMEERILFLGLAALTIIFIFLVPQMTRFHIKFLRMLKWKSLADYEQKHTKQIVAFVRIIMTVIVIYLIALVLNIL